MDAGKLLGVMGMFIIFTVMVSGGCAYVKTYKIVHFKCAVYCMSVTSHRDV